MSSNDQNRINDDAYVARTLGLAAGAVGTANILVALFTAVATDGGNIPFAQWLTQVNSGTLGSSFQINRRGIYLVHASVQAVASANLQAGLSLDAAQAQLDTSFDATNMLDFAQLITPINTEDTAKLVAVLPIRQSIADSTTLGFVRLHLGDTAGGAPTAAEISLANVRLNIVRVGDLNAA